MKIRMLLFCLLFVGILFSCKKEDLSTGGGLGNTYVPKLSKILIDNKSSNEFIYNDSDLLTDEKSKYDYTTNHYNANGQLASSEFYTNDDLLSADVDVSASAMNQATWVTPGSGKVGGILTYEYNDNAQLIKIVSTHPSLTCAEYSLFNYDNNGRINKQTTYWEDIATGYIDYTYDAKGNLSGESLYSIQATGDPSLITTTSYAFDSEPNPYKAHSKLKIPGVSTNANNITKETYTIHTDGSPDKVQVNENTYSYNSLGYPVSKNGNITYVYNK